MIGRTGADLLARRRVGLASPRSGAFRQGRTQDRGFSARSMGRRSNGRTIDGSPRPSRCRAYDRHDHDRGPPTPTGANAGETRVMPSPDPSSVQVPRSAGFAANAVGAAVVEAPRSFGSYQAAPSRRRRTAVDTALDTTGADLCKRAGHRRRAHRLLRGSVESSG